MLNKIKEFFSKMKNDEHSLFEIIMFSISGVVSVVVLVCAIMLGNFMFSKQDTVTDQEADAGSVTGSAVTETEEPSATATPDANSVVHEDDNTNDDIDASLANSDYAYTTTSVNMRSDASLTSSVLTKVPSGTKLKLTKLSDDKLRQHSLLRAVLPLLVHLCLRQPRHLSLRQPKHQNQKPRRSRRLRRRHPLMLLRNLRQSLPLK